MGNANRGNPAPNQDRKNELAAMAELAWAAYMSMI